MKNKNTTHQPFFSPFEPVFAQHSEIPLVFRNQFLHSVENPYHVVLDGHLDVWYHPRWLSPLFWFLESLGILISETGEKIPITLTVRAISNDNGEPYHYWERTFKFRKERYFNTILAYDSDLNKVVDYVGKSGFVFIVWESVFHPPLKFTLDTFKCALNFKGRLLWLPDWTWKIIFGKVHCTVTADGMLGTTYKLDLSIWQPWFGQVFGYRGRFKAIQKPMEETSK